MNSSISCPVSDERINENVGRIAAAYTLILTTTAVLCGYHWIMAGLAVDFGIRAFTPATLSPMRWISKSTSRLFRLRNIQVDAAPKKFAAGMGMIFSILILAAGLLNYDLAEYILASMLIACAILESVFAYCVGCIIYTYLMRFNTTKEETIEFPNSKTG